MNEPLSENPHTFDASDFAVRWNAYAERVGVDYVSPLARFAIEAPNVSDETHRFLREVGLPSGANLAWRKAETAGRRVLDVYARDFDWSAADRARLDPFLLLGFRPNGDPVVLDTAHAEQIVILNHENAFSVAEFVNSSVSQVAECVLIYQELIEDFENEFGEEMELYEDPIPVEMVEQARQKIAQIDPVAFSGNSYWVAQLSDI